MTNKELLSEISKVDTSSGGLAPVQLPASFITDLVAEDQLLKDLRIITGIRKEYQLMALSIGNRKLRKGTESTAPATEDLANPEIGYRTLEPVEMILPYNISFRWIKQNIAGDMGEKQLNEEFQKAFKNDLVDLAFNGDITINSGADCNFLNIVSGYVKKIKSDTNVNLFDRSGDDDWKGNVFPGLLGKLPARFKMNYNDLFILCSNEVKEQYISQIAMRNSAVGDSYLIENPKVFYKGIEVKAVPELSSGIIILTPKKNLAIGFGEEMTLYKEDDTRARIRKYTIESYVDFNYVISKAISYCV